MAHVLHLGPYPTRDASFVAATRGAVVNFMHRPRASRIGLAVAAQVLARPDRRPLRRLGSGAVGEFPGLEPLARACSSWVDNPSPIAACSNGPTRTRHGRKRFLAGGCRDDLDPALASEVEPWLAQWEAEAPRMQAALWLLARRAGVDGRSRGDGARPGTRRGAAETQAFGIRFAYYPVSVRRR